MPEIVDQLEVEVQRLGLENEVFTTRMTGCPNGCARPYNSDIGLVGKTKDKYTIFLGGRVLGDRLNFIYKDLVRIEDVVPELAAVLQLLQGRPASGRVARRLLPSPRCRRPAGTLLPRHRLSRNLIGNGCLLPPCSIAGGPRPSGP